MGAIKSLVPTTPVTTGAVTYYTAPSVPANALTRITSVVWSNTTGAPVSATLHNVPLGGAAGAGNAICPTIAVPANTMILIEAADSAVFVIPAGGFLAALAGAAGMLLTVAGEEIT